MSSSLHAVSITQRPPPTPWERFRTISFVAIFTVHILFLHAFQLLFVWLLLVPHPLAKDVYRSSIIYSKEAFASELILLVHFFGPSKFVFTADDSIDLSELVKRDENGKAIRLKLEKQAVWISNHQAYTDWLYIWILMSFGSVSAGLIIVLKASLEWAPLVGPAMQFFSFCFIDKKKTLAKSNLFRTAQDAVKRSEAYQLLLFPEGTLYSALTRPKSAKYAETLGIPNATNVLLPRAAGLLFTLRCLVPAFPSLALYDLTLGYEGVPAQKYAQSYYTLMSIFGRGIAPPAIHLHLRQIPLSTVPIGEVRENARPAHIEKEITKEEKEVFEGWLRGKWDEKDRLMGEFGENGEFPRGEQGRVEVEVRMRAGDWILLASSQVFLFLVVFFVRKAWRFIS